MSQGEAVVSGVENVFSAKNSEVFVRAFAHSNMLIAHSSRACLKIGDVSGSEGFWAAGKQFFCRNPGGFQEKIVPSRGQKTRRLGMLPCFKQALKRFELFSCSPCGKERESDYAPTTGRRCRAKRPDLPGGGPGQAAMALERRRDPNPALAPVGRIGVW